MSQVAQRITPNIIVFLPRKVRCKSSGRTLLAVFSPSCGCKGLMTMYLSDDEKAQVEKQGREGGLDVAAVDPRGVTFNLNMKMLLGSGYSSKYVLIKEWETLVRDNGLKKDDLVELWCFRANSKLNLAINVTARAGLC